MWELKDAKVQNGIWTLYYRHASGSEQIDTWWDKKMMERFIGKKNFKKALFLAVI
jgi:hypothetical protein